MRRIAWLLIALALTAGCLGMGEEEPTDAETNAQDPPEPQDEPETNETGNATLQRTWTRDTYEGSVTGTGVPFGLTVVPLSENNNVNFQAEEGIQVLYLNLTTEGGELQMAVGGPGCEANAGCEESVTTSDGEAQYANETPAPGEWSVRMFPADPVAHSVSYTLEVTQGVEAATDA